MGLGYYLSIQLNYFETTARHELQQLHDVLDRSVLLETEIVAFAGYMLRPDAQAYAVGPFDARDDFGQRDVIEGDDPVTDQQQVAHRHFVDFEQLGVGVIDGLLAGMQVTCVCPEAYRPAADVLMLAHKYGSAFHFTSDPVEGVRDADVVATAVWNTAAPGTAESEQRLRDFVGFQLTGKLLEAAKPDAMVLHCLPAHRGEEISTAVFEQHADEIFDEAENRLHVQKAVLAILLAGK